MYMRGQTTPVAIDGTKYRIRALAHERPFADFNDDGVVDGEDLARWKAPAGHLNSNFLLWQRQFGEAPPLEAEFEAAIAAASANESGIPEPTTLSLVAAGAVLLASFRHRSGRSAAV
jgi:hypothetical protein